MTWKGLITDLMGLAGVALIATGVWWISPAWSLVVTGSIMLALALLAAVRGAG